MATSGVWRGALRFDDEAINPPRPELQRMRTGRRRLLDRRGPDAIDLHTALLDEPPRFGRRRDEPGLPQDLP